MPTKPKNEKIDTSFWDKRRGKIFSKKGGAITGEAVYCHGYSMLDDLLGKKSYFQCLILNATGRMPERRLADWLEAYFYCLSYPDPRIWCNQIGSLAGTMRASPVAGVCAGILASDSRMYGPGTSFGGAEFITTAAAKKRDGMTAEEILDAHPKRRPDNTPVIVGYSRPVARGDERVVALERVTRDLGFEKGEHLTLAFEIDEILYRKYKESMNSAGFRSAFLSDQGFTPREIFRLISIIVNSGVNACYVEAFDNPPESFFPLRCEDVEYQGEPPRKLPDNN